MALVVNYRPQNPLKVCQCILAVYIEYPRKRLLTAVLQYPNISAMYTLSSFVLYFLPVVFSIYANSPPCSPCLSIIIPKCYCYNLGLNTEQQLLIAKGTHQNNMLLSKQSLHSTNKFVWFLDLLKIKLCF